MTSSILHPRPVPNRFGTHTGTTRCLCCTTKLLRSYFRWTSSERCESSAPVFLALVTLAGLVSATARSTMGVAYASMLHLVSTLAEPSLIRPIVVSVGLRSQTVLPLEQSDLCGWRRRYFIGSTSFVWHRQGCVRSACAAFGINETG